MAGKQNLLAVFVLVIAAPVLVSLITVLYLSGWIASIPSKIGGKAPAQDWIRKLIGYVIDFDLMTRFRDDVLLEIRPHMEVRNQGNDRYWTIRQMEQTINKTENRIQSGEFVVALVLSLGGIALSSLSTGVPLAVFLTAFTLIFSALVATRVILIDVLAIDPDNHIEASTEDLTVLSAFNQGPLSQGSSVPMALLTIFVGVTGGTGYDLGLEILEFVSEQSHPDSGERWYVDGTGPNVIRELSQILW